MKTNVDNNDYKSPQEQQAEAWASVYETLVQVAPDLMKGGTECGRVKAVNAIKELAEQVNTAVLLLDLSTTVINALNEKLKLQQTELNAYKTLLGDLNAN